MDVETVIKIVRHIESIQAPSGKIPFWLKLTSSKDSIARMTFEAAKLNIIHEVWRLHENQHSGS